MIALTDPNELNKILRQELILQSQLDSDKVLNALSIHGEDLDKLFEEQIYVSIDRSDVLLLFELQSRVSESDISMTLEDSSVEIYRSFTFRVVLYGNDSTRLASIIAARFRTEQVRNSLYSQGIYIERVSEPVITNDYKNQTMWIRNDIEIEISSKFLISQISDEADFNSASVNKIFVKED